MINTYVAAGYALIWASLIWFGWRTHVRVRAAERAMENALNEDDK